MELQITILKINVLQDIYELVDQTLHIQLSMQIEQQITENVLLDTIATLDLQLLLNEEQVLIKIHMLKVAVKHVSQDTIALMLECQILSLIHVQLDIYDMEALPFLIQQIQQLVIFVL